MAGTGEPEGDLAGGKKPMTIDVTIIMGIVGLLLSMLLAWIGFTLQAIRSDTKIMRDDLDNFINQTEHRLTLVETKQKHNIDQIGEIWHKCFGTWSKNKEENRCD